MPRYIVVEFDDDLHAMHFNIIFGAITMLKGVKSVRWGDQPETTQTLPPINRSGPVPSPSQGSLVQRMFGGFKAG